MAHLHSFLAAAVLLAACACTKELHYDSSGAESMLIVNAQLSSDRHIHTVYLAKCTSGAIEKINCGSVVCYINDSIAVKAEADTSSDDSRYIIDEKLDSDVQGYAPGRMKQTRFIFSASFLPGDKVRLQCEADGKFPAWSEVTVPEAPLFEITDTSSIILTDKESQKESYRITIKGKDTSGQRNFYRLTTEYSRRYCSDGSCDSPYKSSGNLRQDTETAFVLSEELSVYGTDTQVKNYFSIFSNRLFLNGIYNFYYSVDAPEDEYLPEEYEQERPDAISETSVCPVIWAITENEYLYLKALSLYFHSEDDFSMAGPVFIPDNIVNGKGIFSIATPSRDTVVFRRSCVNPDAP